MNRQPAFLVLILLLISIGLSSIYYRHVHNGVPLSPGQRIDVWQVEAEVSFIGVGLPATVRLAIPRQKQFEIKAEYTASPAYGVTLSRNADAPNVLWSKNQVEGLQTLYYKANFKNALNVPADSPPLLPLESLVEEPEPYHSSAVTILKEARARSGNQKTLVQQLQKVLNSQTQNSSMLLSRYSRTKAFRVLLDYAGIPAKIVRGLQLEDERRNQRLIPLVKVYADNEWQIINVGSRALDEELPLLIWVEDQPSALDVEGGTDSKLRFSISNFRTSAVQEANLVAQQNSWPFGLYSLPIAEQNLFRSILLIPIGALVVVFFRILVGLRCSGTFMPVLMATAFIQTELLNGILSFSLVVAAGLVIRSYLSHLNLLMVSRISAVVLVVIGIIIMFTVFAFRMGLTEALTITFFPMIIMAWTIERMSILWEEEGPREVLIQGGGSLFIAVVAYLLMDNGWVRHWAFNFLGVHALVMATILIIGQYTGYRLTELKRFRPLG